MNSAAATTRPTTSRRRSLWRFLWVFLLVLHAPATVKVFSVAIGGESDWSSAVLMTATNIFFVLEIIFGWSLHLLSDRRSALVFLLIVAMLHAGVIDRAMPDVLGEDSMRAALLLTIGVTLVARLFISRIPLSARILADLAAIRFLVRRRAFATVPPPARLPMSPQVLARTRPHRAPPF